MGLASRGLATPGLEFVASKSPRMLTGRWPFQPSGNPVVFTEMKVKRKAPYTLMLTSSTLSQDQSICTMEKFRRLNIPNPFQFIADRWKSPSSSQNEVSVERGLEKISFDEFHEEFDMQKLEELDINFFDEVVEALQSQMLLRDEERMVILSEKYAKKNELKVHDFIVSSPGSITCGKTVSRIRENGKEMDFAYAVRKAEFKLSKKNKKDTKLNKPSSELCNAEKEVASEEVSNKQITEYLSNKCTEMLSIDYPNLVEDKKAP